MMNDVDSMFNEINELLGEGILEDTFNDENIPVAMSVDDRIKILEEYALKIIDIPEFDPSKDFIRFRKIRLLKLNRVHSLLVDVIKDKKRYTAALKKRISTGERDPVKWIRDVNEAVSIALSGNPVALCAVENRIADYTRGIVEVRLKNSKSLNEGVVFIWGTQIADCRGPIKNVIEILDGLQLDETKGLIIQSTGV
jgi:hypothetical protein